MARPRAGRRSGIELPNSLKCSCSQQWKRDVKGNKWYACETISVRSAVSGFGDAALEAVMI